MGFCIPRHLIARLKESTFRGEVDISGLYEMSSKQRNEYFSKLTAQEVGKFLNVEFEKAIVKKRLTEWVESAFDPKAKEGPVYKNIVDKINDLDEMGVLSPVTEKEFLADFISDKLGVSAHPEEIRTITEKASRIETAQEKLGEDIGLVTKEKENLEFFKAKKDMDDYLQSLNPASRLKVATGTIGRGFMLASVKSPILNIGSNMEVALTEAISRRIASGQYKGADNALAVDYVKMANKIYQETGYDISRMMNLSDAGPSGQRVLGDTVHAKGPGVVRKVGQVVEDVVFKQLMGAPDVAFSSAHFADSVNLNSLKLAKGDAKLAAEWMQDAMRLEPKTDQGAILKAQGVLDAQVATWTNTTWASKTSEGIRGILNEVSGDLRLGDYLLPFIRTTANVVATGMDYAGMGAVKALGETVKAWKSGELGSQEHIQSVTRNLARAGLGFTGAAVISGMLNDDDFVGAYDPSRRQIEQLRNSNYNAVRIGNKWISTAWLGPLAVPVTAMMYARKYGKTGPEQVFQYGKGVVSQVKDIPGVSDLFDFFKAQQGRKNLTLEEATGESRDFIVNEIASRLIPSISADMAKALDPYERQTKGHPIAVKIPFARQALPKRANIFGEEVKGESPLSDILFGARVKTSQETPLIKELNRLSEAIDKPLNFTDFDKSSSKRLKQFRDSLPAEKFNSAKKDYGQDLQQRINRYISSGQYRNASDEDRYKEISNLDTQSMSYTFRKHGFLYHKDRPVPFQGVQ